MFVRIRGRSMLPGLRSGDIVWCSKAADFRRGQLLLIRKIELLVKRLVGLPGDHVALKNGTLWLNGTLTLEPYLSPLTHLEPYSDRAWQLREGEYCVLGDTRDDSLDSRKFGPIRTDEIVGALRFRLWRSPKIFDNFS